MAQRNEILPPVSTAMYASWIHQRHWAWTKIPEPRPPGYITFVTPTAEMLERSTFADWRQIPGATLLNVPSQYTRIPDNFALYPWGFPATALHDRVMRAPCHYTKNAHEEFFSVDFSLVLLLLESWYFDQGSTFRAPLRILRLEQWPLTGHVKAAVLAAMINLTYPAAS